MPKLQRTGANPLSALIKNYLNSNHLSAGVNGSCVFSAWDNATGAGEYTSKKFFKDGTLYITMCSSVVANQFFFQKEDIRKRINAILATDPLFQGGENPVKKLVIK